MSNIIILPVDTIVKKDFKAEKNVIIYNSVHNINSTQYSDIFVISSK